MDDQLKQFEMHHLFFKNMHHFSELTAPDWLTSCKTVIGSTMDNRWFWNEYVLQLAVGERIKTDFHCIERIG